MSPDGKPRSDGIPDIATVLDDPAASFWLKAAIRSALSRDPVAAANDAELLFRLLMRRCDEILRDSQAGVVRLVCDTETTGSP
jgi:hypothetical protein